MGNMKAHISLMKGYKLHNCLVFCCLNIEFLSMHRNEKQTIAVYFLRINDKYFQLFMCLLGIYFSPQLMPWEFVFLPYMVTNQNLSDPLNHNFVFLMVAWNFLCFKKNYMVSACYFLNNFTREDNDYKYENHNKNPNYKY